MGERIFKGAHLCNRISAVDNVVSIEFSPLSTVELTTNWYQLHNGDYQVILNASLNANS